MQGPNPERDTPNRVGLSATDTQTLSWQWAVGGRIGYVLFPQLLTYVSGGYTEARFSGATYQTQGIGNIRPLTGMGMARGHVGATEPGDLARCSLLPTRVLASTIGYVEKVRSQFLSLRQPNWTCCTSGAEMARSAADFAEVFVLGNSTSDASCSR
jgi:hypothetical protein